MSLKESGEAGCIVKVTESAAIDMCLCGLEAFVVQHKKYQKKPLETYALVWGHESTLRDGRTMYVVEKVSVDTSADRSPGSCTPKDDALALKYDFMQSYFPDIEFLGDFHTHPFLEHANTIRNEKMYEFSEQDIKSVEDNSDVYTAYNYRVGFVMTIASVKTKSQNAGEMATWEERACHYSAVIFRLNNYRIWLQAYVATNNDGRIHLFNDKVVLEVPGILGLHGPYTPFGAFSDKKHVVRSKI
ncbi:hypothetical protein LJC46_07490 [Desulfovibrio sp. OttesenSCG-928-G15]|nr:hypothetical protein [Desulfovibrio sp. OttesenSCG-928-G15]